MTKRVMYKYLFYFGVAALFFLAVFLICLFATGESTFYSTCWAVLAGGYGLVAARIGFHLALKDNSPEMWQVTIYLVLAVTGWLIAILANSYAITTLGIAMVVAFLMMGLGTRFIKNAGDWVRTAIGKDLSFYEENSRWKFIDDDIEKGDDTERALCSVNGNPLTIAEAKAQGYVKESEEGIAYLQSCLGKE